MPEPIRYVREIGLYAFSRGCLTCLWKTSWCKQNCYNRKFYRVNPKLDAVDFEDELYWNTTHAEGFARQIKNLQIRRFRFAVRGEIWNTGANVMKVAHILKMCPDVLFWIPTRAWRHDYMYEIIHQYILTLPNSRVMASIDITTTHLEEVKLHTEGWSIVFTGDNSDSRQMMLDGSENRTAEYVKCLKTWRHKVGHCAECTKGCFSANRVDVHLKQHK